MEQIMPILEYVRAQFGCTFRDAERIATRLADGGFRLGMLAVGSIADDDLTRFGGLAPFEAAALLRGAGSLPARPPEGEKMGDVLASLSTILQDAIYLTDVADLRQKELVVDMAHLNAARNGVFAADRELKKIAREIRAVVDMFGGDEPPAPDDPGASDGEAAGASDGEAAGASDGETYYNPTMEPYSITPSDPRSPKRARSD